MEQIALVNARVRTMSGDNPGENEGLKAVLLEDGRIAGVGLRDHIAKKISSDTRVFDLNGACLLPGFIDAHLHPVYYGQARQGLNCLPPAVNSIADICREARARAEVLGSGVWIEGFSYDDTRLEERRHPTREELDRAAPRNPVVIRRVCGHMSVANTPALHRAGITLETPDPPGGIIDRDEEGEPTGLLRETAQDLVLRMLEPSWQRLADILRGVSLDLLSHGITSIGHAHLHSRREVEVWEELLRDGDFKPGVGFMPDYSTWKWMLGRERDDCSQLDVVGVKFFGDGSISGRTAALMEPYEGNGGLGVEVSSRDQLTSAFEHVVARGSRVAVHAMGDRAIGTALEVLREVTADSSARACWLRPHRIEHCSLPSREHIEAMLALNAVPVVQPIFMFAEGEAYLDNLGPHRAVRAYPLRTMLDKGLRPALSSDAPATTWADATDVLLGVKSAVMRRTWAGRSLGKREAVTVGEALRGYTIDAARAMGRSSEVGTIEPGKRADLVVLSSDPLEVEPGDLGHIKVVATFAGGHLAWGDLD